MMKTKRYRYGMMGFLSLLGFLGIFTEERTFLAFFAFAVDFEYFFLKSDEMLEQYMNRAASSAFYAGMLVVAAATLVCFFAGGQEESRALVTGLACGWAASVVVYAVLTAYYSFRERQGLAD